MFVVRNGAVGAWGHAEREAEPYCVADDPEADAMMRVFMATKPVAANSPYPPDFLGNPVRPRCKVAYWARGRVQLGIVKWIMGTTVRLEVEGRPVTLRTTKNVVVVSEVGAP